MKTTEKNKGFTAFGPYQSVHKPAKTTKAAGALTPGGFLTRS